MVAHHCTAELWDVVLKVHQVLALLVRNDIVEMDIFIAPFEVVDDAFVCQFFLNNEDVLEEVDYPLVNVEMIKLSYHSLLVL